MHLDIVIPAFNEEKLLPATLAAVNEAAAAVFPAAGISHAVTVCDNNSTDGTAEVARSGGAAVAFEPVNQISRARKTGASLATGDWLLFIDADSLPSAGLFRELAAVMADDRVLYGGCALVLDEVHPGTRAVLGFWHRLARWRKWAAGSFLFVRREAFVATGGFSTDWYASEEIDFSRRLGKLARQRKQKFAFLTGHPLVTSARKLRFHSGWWHLRFILRTLFMGGRNLRRRDGCALWYDGKR